MIGLWDLRSKLQEVTRRSNRQEREVGGCNSSRVRSIDDAGFIKQ